MDHYNKLPPFHIAFSGLNLNSVQQTYQHDKNKLHPTYQGMPVQTLKYPFPVYVRPESTESSEFGEALPLPNEGTCTSGLDKTSKTKHAAPVQGKESKDKCIAKAKHRAAQARYAASKKGQANRARYLASDNCKVSQAKYTASKKGKAVRAIYNASDQGKASKAKYNASEKGLATIARYNASDSRKASQAKYEASEKGQAAKARKLARYALSREKRISQSIKNARS
ncbi:hypothetical protein ACTL6P_07825 [Endozoicomonas acroporae]|uniref:hypothetical protein n=1 Tax=Endozoicomonas acroporae TaxID=1701104 RepID=UPI000C75CBC9|nr:hypothetical protein [Endozoicomonas acroporae]